MGKLEGKSALITGGSRGIGRAIAIEFAREGANVAINYRRDETAARQTVAEIERLGGRSVPIQADVSDWSAVSTMVETAIDALGHLDIIVANSGVASRAQAIWDLDVDHWHRVLGVDLHGVFYTCKASVPHLLERKQGSIILISSIGADVCAGYGAPYYVAKAGVNALTKTLAKECAPAGVRVNAIAPGLIKTDMGERMIDFLGQSILSSIPLGEAGRPEDIGRAAVYLTSDDGRYVTGKILRIDGGQWM